MNKQTVLMILCILFGLAGISYGIFSHNSKNVATDTQATVAGEEQIAPETEQTTDTTEKPDTPKEWVVTADKTEFLYRNERFGFEILFPKVFEDLRVEVKEQQPSTPWAIEFVSFSEPTTSEHDRELFRLYMHPKDDSYNDATTTVCTEEWCEHSRYGVLTTGIAFETDKYVASYWSDYERWDDSFPIPESFLKYFHAFDIQEHWSPELQNFHIPYKAEPYNSNGILRTIFEHINSSTHTLNKKFDAESSYIYKNEKYGFQMILPKIFEDAEFIERIGGSDDDFWDTYGWERYSAGRAGVMYIDIVSKDELEYYWNRRKVGLPSSILPEGETWETYKEWLGAPHGMNIAIYTPEQFREMYDDAYYQIYSRFDVLHTKDHIIEINWWNEDVTQGVRNYWMPLVEAGNLYNWNDNFKGYTKLRYRMAEYK